MTKKRDTPQPHLGALSPIPLTLLPDLRAQTHPVDPTHLEDGPLLTAAPRKPPKSRSPISLMDTPSRSDS